MNSVRVFLSPEAAETYKSLKKEALKSKDEKAILDSLHKKTDLIKENIHFGQPIAKKLIPDEYKTKYNTKNLFRVELPKYWRMLYTLTGSGSNIEIVVLVIDVMDHKTYDKKFGYRRK